MDIQLLLNSPSPLSIPSARARRTKAKMTTTAVSATVTGVSTEEVHPHFEDSASLGKYELDGTACQTFSTSDASAVHFGGTEEDAYEYALEDEYALGWLSSPEGPAGTSIEDTDNIAGSHTSDSTCSTPDYFNGEESSEHYGSTLPNFFKNRERSFAEFAEDVNEMLDSEVVQLLFDYDFPEANFVDNLAGEDLQSSRGVHPPIITGNIKSGYCLNEEDEMTREDEEREISRALKALETPMKRRRCSLESDRDEDTESEWFEQMEGGRSRKRSRFTR
ncbi:hypothetical protein BJ508DRAFT_164802 [Ascobolus immersus RN42]|uniref:Uncharacterized protein n=1 Tax=Ascobolus immersus RN42 TaxID=1160509 RepID=A0A3N4I0F3_ASCIM|nr:hypothetical protein BJ508DRAFT_164802 [Ascobolus immersus RN42]